MEMEQLRKDIADTKKLVFDIARSLEKIENVILPTEYNNNRGILQAVGEMQAKIEALEKFKNNTELLQAQDEKKSDKLMKWMGLCFAAMVVIQIGLQMYELFSKK